ncbi:hypothetical protein, partial [Planobispora rosea]|uniref:hypothetical protein n=1 Tax=Planobispora rosea TaxID=35762 RepID=UPI00159EFC01
MSTPPPTRRRGRTTAGHRTIRVNLRLSAEEHAELAEAARLQGETLAGYAAAAALTLAGDHMPPDAAAQWRRIMDLRTGLAALHATVKKLTAREGAPAAEVSATLAAVREVVGTAEDTLHAHGQMMVSERRRRANRDRRQ